METVIQVSAGGVHRFHGGLVGMKEVIGQREAMPSMDAGEQMAILCTLCEPDRIANIIKRSLRVAPRVLVNALFQFRVLDHAFQDAGARHQDEVLFLFT